MSGAVIQIFANATAGTYRALRLDALRRGLEQLGAQVLVSYCGPDAEPDIDERATGLCAFGGDGTARHVVAAVLDGERSLPVGIYPAGTVNLLAREMFDTPKAADVARLPGGTERRLHYVAEINGQAMLVCASVGPDSRAVAGVSARLKRWTGKLAYVIAFLSVLLRWRRNNIRLRWEDGEAECEAFYVAKGRYFAGPWSFAPEASVADPCLHVVALEHGGRLAYLRFLLALYRGRTESCRGVRRFVCQWLEAEADTPVPLQVDGDHLGELPVSIRLRAEPVEFF